MLFLGETGKRRKKKIPKPLSSTDAIERAHFVVVAIPVIGVLFFSLSTSIVKSSFRKRNPIMENR